MTQPNLKNNPSSTLLKDTRQTKGLTLEIVHEATKIPMDALRAIEEGYSTRILTPFYYRGFIKIYAEFLGLNVVDVLKEYNVQKPEVKVVSTEKPAKPSKPVVTSTPRPKSAKPTVQPEPNILIEELQRTIRQIWTSKTRMLLLRILVGVVAIFILVKFVGCVAGVIKNKPKAKSKVVAIVKKPVIKKEQLKEEPKVKAKSEEESDLQEPIKVPSVVEDKNHKVTLTVRASKDSWIQVKTDGKVVFQMMMKKGTMENWESKDQIELSGKNLGDLVLEVNGKEVGSLGTFNRRAKKVVITKDGLTVKK